ncbi:hypothetical protein SADUNF_Sadunf01G0147200 [Salix dunnii]|uniref:MYB transcription factor n=1 Tax=Salix dunnii TaxID=1413687 RepID=A0A835NCD9_9ROSI|nr:hypothetical protein SADUNF_Sadunf01G0147200 [Salix dunnii]
MPNMKKESAKPMERGAWTTEEDRKLTEVIEIHGAKRWRTIASRAGNACAYNLEVYFLLQMKEIKNLRPRLKYIEDSNREGQKNEKKTAEFNLELKEDTNPRNGCEEGSNVNFNIDDFFDFSDEDPLNLEWMSRFLEMDEA